MNEFEEILKGILDEVDSNNGTPIDEVLQAAAVKAGLTSDEISELQESLTLLDKIDEKNHELQAARRDKETRKGWLQRQLDKILGKVESEDRQKEILEAISVGTAEAVKLNSVED